MRIHKRPALAVFLGVLGIARTSAHNGLLVQILAVLGRVGELACGEVEEAGALVGVAGRCARRLRGEYDEVALQQNSEGKEEPHPCVFF